MHMQLRQLLLALLALPLALAFDISGNVISNSILNITSLPAGSAVLLDHGAKKAFIREDGHFLLTGVDEGRHVVETFIPGYTVGPLVVTVQPDSIHVQAHHPARLPYPLAAPSLAYPLTVSAVGKDDYFLPPPGLNVFGLLKSPMVLMMLGSAAMMYFMPKLMANMDVDPEMAKEMADTRKKMQGLQGDWTASLSNMLAGATDEAAPVAPAVQVADSSRASTPSRGGNGGGGKRGKRR